MAYRQLLGNQSSSKFTLRRKENGMLKPIVSITIRNTSPDISFPLLYEPVDNWKKSSVYINQKVKAIVNLEVLNVFSGDFQNINTLIYMINMSRLKGYYLYIYPYNNGFGFPCITNELSIDNVKKFINTAQKIPMTFTSKNPLNKIPSNGVRTETQPVPSVIVTHIFPPSIVIGD